ncbi:MAG: TOTE conflict system archaeo-eukaryotic primase domain-containing protein [bacterium]
MSEIISSSGLEIILPPADEKLLLKKKINKINKQIDILTALKAKYAGKLNKINLLLNPASDPFVKENIPSFACSMTSDKKIELFRSYFIGREDLYARLWISAKTGKHGYSPACKNEWVRSLCRKPAVKCASCANREFLPLDYSAIKMHLTGKHTVGIYPLTKDENCCFLAFDFDGKQWLDDAASLKCLCTEEGIPSAIEISRSGEGGHLWIFFNEKVPAVTARKLGSYLITKTMRNNFKLDIKSYDRMFPNQDTLPEGGFGNLIALPFQKNAVLKGNSVFIDENAVPYIDQWGFLNSVEKMMYKKVIAIVDKADRIGQIIEIKNGFVSGDEESWTALQGKSSQSVGVQDNKNKNAKKIDIDAAKLPQFIETIQSNRIYIKTNNISSELLNLLKNLASFQNPEFYKKQQLRLSTHATPRIICCAELKDEYLSLPRGCIEDAESLLKDYNIKLNNSDKRNTGKKIQAAFRGVLTDTQQNALDSILSFDLGVLVAPPGTGKTVMAVAAIARRSVSALVLVHRKQLMEQWRLQLSALLCIDKKEIGVIGGGKNNPTGNIDIATIQSLSSYKEGSANPAAGYGFIIVDECHHIGAFSFEKVLNSATAKYILGLTATPYRRDGHQAIINMQCGNIRHQIKQKDITENCLKASVIIKQTNFTYEYYEHADDFRANAANKSNKTNEVNKININDLWNKLIEDNNRNDLIVRDIIDALDKGIFPLVITERKKHLELLETMLRNKADLIAVFHGGIKLKSNRATLDKLRNSSRSLRRVILATGSYIGEGFDEPGLNALFLTMPISFKGRLIQYSGRLCRNYKDKQDIYIYDYLDENVSILAAMYKKRIKTYKLLDYTLQY